MSDLIKPWILLEEDDISPSVWYPLRKQKVQLPNGLVIDDYFGWCWNRRNRIYDGERLSINSETTWLARRIFSSGNAATTS